MKRKTRKTINSEYYQKRKDDLNKRALEKYHLKQVEIQNQKELEKETQSVYNDKSINVLLSLKDYINLSKEQKKL
jgi:hypothetical protein